jgi:hypothetical protein
MEMVIVRKDRNSSSFFMKRYSILIITYSIVAFK